MTSKQLVGRIIKTYADASLTLLQRIVEKQARGTRTAFERALLQDVAQVVADLDVKAGAWLQEAVPQFYLEGMQQNLDALRELGVDVAKQATITKVHESAIKVLVENAFDDLTTANHAVGRKVRDNLRRIGLDAVTTKVSTGQTVRETAKGIRERLAAEGLKSVQGMRLEAYASMVARSTSAEAQNRGSINSGTELSYDLVRMSSHNSPCPVCAKFENRIYSVSGKDKNYPPLYGTAFKGGYASIHANCRHRLSSWVEPLADDPEGDRARSSRPFVDDRTERQRTAYLEAQARRREARARKLKKLEAQING